MLVGFENTLYTPLVRHHGGAYLESVVPTAACEMAIVFRSAGCAFFVCHDLTLRIPSSFLRHILRTITAMAIKITAGELSARVKTNVYQRAHLRAQMRG